MRVINTTNQIGALLASRRKHLKLSQSDVASRIGLSQNRLSVLESDPDSLTIKQLFALLGALGLEMSVAEKKPPKAQPE
jgi:HTH-type transcriptional regulator / antitoxin HipB